MAGVSAILREQYWQAGRLHRIWWEPDTGRVTHERLTPPKHIEALAARLESLRASKRERAQRADGLYQIAQFTTNERDDLFKLGIKGGDVDGLKWALKQDKWRHARTGNG